jgi:WD40 repeat protein
VPGPRFTGQFAPVALSPDGKTLAYGLVDGTVRFFDIASGKTILGEGAHSGEVNRMTFSPDSRVAVSTGDDGLAIIWDPKTGKVLQRLTGHASRVFAADFSPDSETLYTPGIDGAILQYDLGTSRRFGRPFSVGVGLPRGNTLAVPPLLAVSPDGRTLAASVEQSAVSFFSTSTLRRVARISLAPTRNVFQGAWAGNGRFVVGADEGLVQVWAIGPKPRLAAVLPGLSRKRTVQSVASGEGGHLIAAVDAATAPESGPPPPPQGELGLWRDGKLVGGHTLDLHTNGSWVAISPDGRLAAVSPDDGLVLIVNTRTGHVERRIRPPDSNPGNAIGVVAFSPDGTLATGSFSGAVSLWNPATGKMIGHTTVVANGPVAGLAFAPDGKTFATAGFGGATRIWETSTLQQFGTDFPSSTGLWGNVAYTPDGRSFFYTYGDGSAYRFPATIQAWERQACAEAGRNLTTEEWRRFVGGRSYSKVCR